MARNPADALARFNAQTTNAVGMCLRETRVAYNIPGGVPDASTSWRQAIGRHAGDRNPPIGAPVFWTGGSRGHGHIAIFAGNGMCRSTDAAGNGRMGTVGLDWPDRTWRTPYAGWAEGFNGVRIPGLGGGQTITPPTGGGNWDAGDVWVSKLRRNQRDSDSVRRLQARLNAVIGAGLPITGNYLDQTNAAVRRWQASIGNAQSDSLGPKQAARLFPPPYTVR